MIDYLNCGSYFASSPGSRLDDSNAKLDEVVKLFATNLAYRLGDIS